MDLMEFTSLLTSTHTKFDTLQNQIKRLKRTSCTSDLNRLLATSLTARDSISKELVECRRIKQITAKCQTLLVLYVQSVETLDEYVTFGILLNS